VRGHKRWGPLSFALQKVEDKEEGRCEKGIQKGSQKKEKEKESMYTTKGLSRDFEW
jgi:hypothetical protein